MIKLYNENGVEAEADLDQVEIMEDAGWSRAKPEKKKKKKKEKVVDKVDDDEKDETPTPKKSKKKIKKG